MKQYGARSGNLDISRLLDPDCFDHPVTAIKLIETHISWVLLAGDFAYKIKKPVNFGFLDFSTLDKRHHYCNEELRLNRRLAPALYLGVVAITGDAENPSFRIPGPAIDYAVLMRRFPGDCQLDAMLKAGRLGVEQMDEIATMVAEYHGRIDCAERNSDFGEPQSIFQPALENFAQIRERYQGSNDGRLAELESWTREEHARLEPLFLRRKHDGFVRECHGDMHLGNMIWLDGRPLAFDCIEFNPNLRWIDVISEVAFLYMDLEDRGQLGLAHRFLNRYLEHTGDYAALGVLRYYLCYRAMVRAKVQVLRLTQNGQEAAKKEAGYKKFDSYVELASGYTHASAPGLLLMRGASASGKSTISLQLADASGAIRLRSDVERKRLFGIAAEQDAATGPGEGIYCQNSSRLTYQRLAELARQTINSGYSVIIDATCLRREQREHFAQLAKELDVAYHIVEITAPREILQARIQNREKGVSDAGLEVLQHQLASWEALDEDELAHAVKVESHLPVDIDALAGQLFDQRVI